MSKLIAALLLASAAATLAACGSPPVTPGLTSKVATILTKTDAAVQSVDRQSSSEQYYATVSRVEPTTATRLRALSFPASASSDAQALETGLDRVGRDAALMAKRARIAALRAEQATRRLKVRNPSPIRLMPYYYSSRNPVLDLLRSDEVAAVAARNALCRDLGLPSLEAPAPGPLG
jgi:hypothetical protein